MNVKAAEYQKISGFHSSFPSRNDILVEILSQYRCRHSKNHVADFTSTKTYSLHSKNMSLILRQPKHTPHVGRNRSNP
jgi:hypothetical protein